MYNRGQRNETIYDLWLACYTDEEIAAKLDCPIKTMQTKTATLPEIIGSNNFRQSRDFPTDPDFTPPLYNVWLACYTDEEIAAKLDCPLQTIATKTGTISEIIQKNNFRNSRDFPNDADFTPPLYNVWLACYTDEEIAKVVGKSHDQVTKQIVTFTRFIGSNKTRESRNFPMDTDFTPPLYNVGSFAGGAGGGR
ncbi:MAG: hypothetical protein M1546_19955 [Chloroflexi bacterium]|nr:hypothetical protein [Chloroflexota bacterium]